MTQRPIVLVRIPGPGEPTQAQKDRGNYPKRVIDWHGMVIRVENEAGTYRRGRSRSGHEWEALMKWPYGYFERTVGVDGDEVDVYVGMHPEAEMVYIVHQSRYGDWSVYDEDKCFVNFMTEDDARAAFLSSYDDPRFLGPITAMPVGEFIDKARATRKAPAMIKAILFFKAQIKGYVKKDGTFVAPHNDKRPAAQMDLFADIHADPPKPAHPPEKQPLQEVPAAPMVMLVIKQDPQPMNKPFTRSYDGYKARAEEALAAGFKTEAARKAALYDLSAAFEIIRRSAMDHLLMDRAAPDFNDLYDAMPYDLHQWRPKHSAAMVGRLPGLVENANALSGLREAIKAVEIVKEEKVKTVTTTTKTGEKVKVALGDYQHHPVGKAVEPMKADAVQRAERDARDLGAKVYAALAKHDWNMDAAAPKGDWKNDRDSERKEKNARRSMFYQFVTEDRARPARLMSDPRYVVASPEALERFVNMSKAEAALQYEAFVSKLVGKIGPAAGAVIDGNHVWGHSILHVVKPDGTEEMWKTQQIVNVSVHGKLFNQWPTRLLKPAPGPKVVFVKPAVEAAPAWAEMSEADRDEANEYAWVRAADRLRQTMSAHPHLDMSEARQMASAAINADMAEDQRILDRSKRPRATKADIRFAANCAKRIRDYALEQGFMPDVEI